MASGTTRRIADGSPVEWSDAIAAWAAAGGPVLEAVARNYGAYVTYQEMAEAVQHATGIHTGVPFRHWIGRVLGALASARHPTDEPLLTSLVVRADGTVGDGYAIPVAEREGTTPTDLDWHAAGERLNCYRYFGAQLPAGGGVPTLTRPVAARRARSRRSAPTQPRGLCPICSIELPSSGRCDTCA